MLLVIATRYRPLTTLTFLTLTEEKVRALGACLAGGRGNALISPLGVTCRGWVLGVNCPVCTSSKTVAEEKDEQAALGTKEGFWCKGKTSWEQSD